MAVTEGIFFFKRFIFPGQFEYTYFFFTALQSHPHFRAARFNHSFLSHCLGLFCVTFFSRRPCHKWTEECLSFIPWSPGILTASSVLYIRMVLQLLVQKSWIFFFFFSPLCYGIHSNCTTLPKGEFYTNQCACYLNTKDGILPFRSIHSGHIVYFKMPNVYRSQFQ